MQRIAVFTDLDGTLIDFQTYSWQVAQPLLHKLLEEGMEVIFCSSKTRYEQQALMQEMGVRVPAIVENGSGIWLPPGNDWLHAENVIEFNDGSRLLGLGPPASLIRAQLVKIEKELRVDLGMYARLEPKELSQLTGLTISAAVRARARDFSETLTAPLSDSIRKSLEIQLNKLGLQCVFGGRFHTVTGMLVNKGNALRMMFRAICESRPGKWKSVAIGDSANDRQMLLAADVACLVQRPCGDWEEMQLPDLKRIGAVGPEGWVRAIEEEKELWVGRGVGV